jgi:hypothetical protein
MWRPITRSWWWSDNGQYQDKTFHESGESMGINISNILLLLISSLCPLHVHANQSMMNRGFKWSIPSSESSPNGSNEPVVI